MDEFQLQMFDVFAYETNDFLARLETILLQSEQDPTALQRQVHEIFRMMHTIKSSAAMMGFSNISVLTHRMEHLFQFIRDFQPETIDHTAITDLLLACIDYMKQCLEQKEELLVPDQLPEAISAYLEQLKRDLSGQEHALVLRICFTPDCDSAALRAFELMAQIKQITALVVAVPAEGAAQEEEILRQQGLCLTFPNQEQAAVIIELIESQPFVASVECQQNQPSLMAEDSSQMPPECNLEQTTSATQLEAGPNVSSGSSEGLLGVDNKKLEQLINISGETVISLQEVLHLYEAKDWEPFEMAMNRMQRLILQIQDRALSLRMVTLNDTFLTLKRSLRDMARELDREIRFTIAGEDLKMDKNMVQHLSSPLLHILRNAVEHGIEPAAERVQGGKAETGTIHLTAGLSGKSAVISITDDGRGIHTDQVLAIAIKRGVITAEEAPQLSAAEIYNLLLMPGFSTKDTVSEYSGRGVGLDVAADNLRKIGGRLQIESTPGEGTCFTLKMPLTLATLDAFLVRVEAEIYTIPLDCVQELFRASEDNIRQINGQDCVLFRDTCYAIRCLHQQPQSRRDYAGGTMLMMQHGGTPYACFVDAVIAHQNVIVKPVPELFVHVSGILGCTVLGSGQVSLIIDDVMQLRKNKK